MAKAGRRALAALMTLACTQAAVAQTPEDFYKGKTVAIVVGHEPGTGFDLYARTISRHMSAHLPGAPTIVVQNMVGASGMNAASWLYNIAPKDGTAIATFAWTAPLEPLLGTGASKGRFDASKFAWIGNADQNVSICGIARRSGVTRFEDLLTKDVILGGTGPTGPLASAGNAIRNLLGAKVKVIDGYKGSVAVRLGILRGELDGVCGISMSSMHAQYSAEIADGSFIPILQFGVDENPQLKGVPPVFRYAKTEADRQVFDLVFGVQSIGRPFAAPPGLPPERVAALRDAFSRTMADAAFAAEIDKQKLDLNPMGGAELQQLLDRVFAAPKDVVDRAKAATKPM